MDEPMTMPAAAKRSARRRVVVAVGVAAIALLAAGVIAVATGSGRDAKARVTTAAGPNGCAGCTDPTALGSDSTSLGDDATSTSLLAVPDGLTTTSTAQPGPPGVATPGTIATTVPTVAVPGEPMWWCADTEPRRAASGAVACPYGNWFTSQPPANQAPKTSATADPASLVQGRDAAIVFHVDDPDGVAYTLDAAPGAGDLFHIAQGLPRTDCGATQGHAVSFTGFKHAAGSFRNEFPPLIAGDRTMGATSSSAGSADGACSLWSGYTRSVATATLHTTVQPAPAPASPGARTTTSHGGHAGAQTALNDAKARWAQQSLPKGYSIGTHVSCHCAGPFDTLTAVDPSGEGQHAVHGNGTIAETRTVLDLFAAIQKAIDDDVATLTVRFSQATGVPVEVTIDPAQQIADDQSTTTTDWFTPR